MRLILFSILSILIVVNCASESVVQSAKSRIKAMRQITESIKNNEFDTFISQLGNLAIPMTSTVHKVTSEKHFSEDDRQDVKESYNLAHDEMAYSTSEFNKVKNMIDWRNMEVSLGSYESAISAAMINLRQVLNAPLNAQEAAMKYFITQFEGSYNNAGVSIYDAVVNTGVFRNNLVLAARKYTEEHRRLVRSFGMGITQVLLQALEVEMSYSEMKYNNPSHTQHVKDTWNNHLQAVKSKLLAEDKNIVKQFPTQQQKDAVRLLKGNQGKSNSQFKNIFYSFMTDKYYWRNWFGVSFDPLPITIAQDSILCDPKSGGRFFNAYGRHLFYASQDKLVKRFNRNSALGVFKKIVQTSIKFLFHPIIAMQMVNNVIGNSCSTYVLRMSLLTTRFDGLFGSSQHYALQTAGPTRTILFG